MEYTVLARRFRPQAFGEVVGQEHIAQALRNAITGERVAHAYLFTGARGVGKTSSARILAKSLNCPNAVNGDPCNHCEVCDAVSTGGDVDVLEIDGASNRGVDEVRTLRANVGVRSMRSRYKIYIIDEVHMLTKEAFNALLKTLEEPPPNVKFIFCTTDPQKLPDTILSRCQRFDFGTIATASIAKRLEEIAEAEGVKVDASAIDLVARRAAGSMRDSQSLFDQLLAFGGKQIDALAVHRLLGTAPDERVIDMVAALIERRRGDALTLFGTALGEGVQLGEFTDQLVNYLRDLMVLASGAKEVPLLSVAEDRREALDRQAQTWGLHSVLAAMQILADAKLKMRGVTYGRPLAEMALVRISLLEDLENLSQIILALKSSKGSVSAPTRAMPGERRVIPAPSSPAIPTSPSVQANRTEDSQLPAAAQATVDALRSLPVASEPPVGRTSQSVGGNQNAEIRMQNAAPSVGRASQPVSLSAAQAAEEELRTSAANPTPVEIAAPADSFPVAAQEDVAPEPEPPLVVPFQTGSESEILSQIVSRATDKQLTQVGLATNAAISGPNQLSIFFSKRYDVVVRLLERPELLGRLEKLVQNIVGRPVSVRLRIEEAPVSIEPMAPSRQPSGRQDVVSPEIEQDAIVSKLVELFGARVVSVENAPADAVPVEILEKATDPDPDHEAE